MGALSEAGRGHGHPGPIDRSGKFAKEDLTWKHIGSGVMAKTYPNANRMMTTSKGGPPMRDIYRRTIRDLRTGRVLDECVVDDTPDSMLHRHLMVPTDIRVEVEMHDALKMFEAKNADVAEVYSQPRIVQEAGLTSYDGVRLVPGWSLDLTREDPLTGEPWDLAKCAVRNRVRELVRKTKPLLLIGSPPCTLFSSLQNPTKGKRDRRKYEKELKIAEGHVKFCLELYEMQRKGGRYFLHEHPNSASSWQMKEVQAMLMQADVDAVTCDMCAYGLTIDDAQGEALAEKRTRLMSNSPGILKRVNKQCSNNK